VATSRHVPICEPAQRQLASVLIVEGEPQLKRKICRRVMPDFPMQITSAGRPVWQKKLERAYKATNAKCGRCPHRGLPLNGLPVKDDKVICPGHGLQFNVKTGEMIPRT
jgi:nitrite reductase/ring-hydroxylating ferredoxin subunit